MLHIGFDTYFHTGMVLPPTSPAVDPGRSEVQPNPTHTVIPDIVADDVDEEQLSSYMMKVLSELQSQHGVEFDVSVTPDLPMAPPPPTNRPAYGRPGTNLSPPWSRR